ncbi:CHASE2 domain-containing protein [Nitrospira sp. Kam-Ns4a]
MSLSTLLEHRYRTAVAIGLAVGLLAPPLSFLGPIQTVELKSLDHRFRLHADPAAASKDLVLVAVDEASLETFGRWPWPRDRHGYLVQYLNEAGAKAIVFDILFMEPDRSEEEFDQVFADSVAAAGNVFLPVLLDEAAASLPLGQPGKALIPLDGPERPASATALGPPGFKLPIPALAEAARGLGFINFDPDPDGVSRRVRPVRVARGGDAMQLATAVARFLLGAERAQVEADRFTLGRASVPLTSEQAMVLNWHGTLAQRAYPSYSAGAVLRSYAERQRGEQPFLDPALFKDKIVFIGTTAAGTYDLRAIPLEPFTPGVLIHMTALDNLLASDALRHAPCWVLAVTSLVLCLGLAFGFAVTSRTALKVGLVLAAALAYYGVASYAFIRHQLWLDLVVPEGALALTYTLSATAEYLREGRQRRLLRSAFDRYMAPEVVDEIMRHPESVKLGGEKKELTVFFSDVAGFTNISEQLSPEVLVEVINQYLSLMTGVILRHRGNVNKYLGDGIMAIFGAPRGDPDHAVQACFAALDVQAAHEPLNRDLVAKGFKPLTTRIGINSGPIVVGNMGSQVRMEYTAMGDSVNLASRLEGANKFYHTLILLGPRTYELACGEIEAREVDLLRVKGKDQPVAVYELMGRKGSLSDTKRRLVDRYLEGLAAYKRRDFRSALERFTEALALDPADGVCQVYRDRARGYLAVPPPEGWDGVYELTSK